MKLKTRILQILGVAAIATIGMTSCDTDACADVECGDNGTCLTGDCICDAGYSGTNCDVAWTTAFEGTYAGIDTCGFAYESTVATTAVLNELKFSNAFGTDATGTATVTSATAVTFDNETINTYVITAATGTLNGNVLTVDYTIDGDACQVVYIK